MKLMILRPQSLLLVAIVVPAALRAASVIQFQTRTLQVSEGSQANIVLTCTPPATNQIRVVVKHVGGTAQCPDDYWMGFAGQCGGFAFEFAPGAADATFFLLAANGGHPEPDETLVLGIAEIGSGAVAGSVTNLTVTITDANEELPATLDLQFAPEFRRWPAISAAAVQVDGKILVAGQELFAGGRQVSLVRLHADGRNDASFRAQLMADVQISSIAPALDGKILVSGYCKDAGRFLTRLLPSGAKDPTFTPSPGEAGEQIVQPDGKIVLWPRTSDDRALHRLNLDGSPDTSFNQNVLAAIRAELSPPGSVVQQSSGKFLVLFGERGTEYPVRLNVDGSKDLTFNSTPFLRGSYWLDGPELVLQSDDRFLVLISDQTGTTHVARFNADGTPDASFQEPRLGAGELIGRPVAEIEGHIYFCHYFAGKILRSDLNAVVDPSFSVQIGHFLDYARLPNQEADPYGISSGWGSLPQFRVIAADQSLLCWSDHTFYANGVYQALVKIPVSSLAHGFIFERDLRGRVSAYESEGVAEVRVYRIGTRSEAASIHYRTSDGTARAGMDYTPAEGALEFAPFESVKSLRVPLIQDRVFRGIKSFFVALSDPSIPASYERPVEVSIYDHELGLVLDSFLLRADGTAELEFDVTGLSFVGAYIIEASQDLKHWSLVNEGRFGGGPFSPLFIRVAIPSAPEFYRVRQR